MSNLLINITYKLYRYANKVFAKTNGLWWAECKHCKEYFGSHEDKYDASPLMSGKKFGPYCGKSDCRKEGRKKYLYLAFRYLTIRGTFEENKILVLQEVWPYQEIVKGER